MTLEVFGTKEGGCYTQAGLRWEITYPNPAHDIVQDGSRLVTNSTERSGQYGPNAVCFRIPQDHHLHVRTEERPGRTVVRGLVLTLLFPERPLGWTERSHDPKRHLGPRALRDDSEILGAIGFPQPRSDARIKRRPAEMGPPWTRNLPRTARTQGAMLAYSALYRRADSGVYNPFKLVACIAHVGYGAPSGRHCENRLHVSVDAGRVD